MAPPDGARDVNVATATVLQGYSGPEPGSDSEDDVPLSELTKLPASSPPPGGQRHGVKRALSPAAEEPAGEAIRRRTVCHGNLSGDRCADSTRRRL